MPKARAEGYNFDFENDMQGNYLDPFVLDTEGDNILVPVGETWRSLGVIITTKNTTRPVGLFQSSCVPENGKSLTAKEISCKQQSYGNNGLATGDGTYSAGNNKEITYKTEPQGNILIIEENPGNGIPDDSPNGGTIRFDFDRTILSSVVVGRMGIVDNAKGTIVVRYMDGEEYVKEFNQENRNQLEYYEIPDGEIEYIEVTFEGNGGITGVEFDKLIALGLPGGVAPSTLSSFTVPGVIAGGLGVFGLLSGGSSGSTNPVEVFEPFFSGDNNNQGDLTSQTPTENNNNQLTENSNNQSNPPSLMSQININSSLLTESEFGSIGPMPESENNPPDEENVVEPIPEPTTVLGTLMALGFGGMMKRKLRQN